MKILVIYYSRTGKTKIAAQQIAKELNCEIEEIIDFKNRQGVLGYLLAGREAMFKKLTNIKKIEKELSDYDLIIIGTPIWAFDMSVAVRTFVASYKNHFKKLAFFCVMGGLGDQRAFKNMEGLVGLKPIATLALRESQVKKGEYDEPIKQFIKQIKNLIISQSL